MLEKKLIIKGVTFEVTYKVEGWVGDWENPPERHVEILNIDHEGDPLMEFLNESTIELIHKQL